MRPLVAFNYLLLLAAIFNPPGGHRAAALARLSSAGAAPAGWQRRGGLMEKAVPGTSCARQPLRSAAPAPPARQSGKTPGFVPVWGRSYFSTVGFRSCRSVSCHPTQQAAQGHAMGVGLWERPWGCGVCSLLPLYGQLCSALHGNAQGTRLSRALTSREGPLCHWIPAANPHGAFIQPSWSPAANPHGASCRPSQSPHPTLVDPASSLRGAAACPGLYQLAPEAFCSHIPARASTKPSSNPSLHKAKYPAFITPDPCPRLCPSAPHPLPHSRALGLHAGRRRKRRRRRRCSWLSSEPGGAAGWDSCTAAD